jgi:hypothetical protein
MGDFRCRFRHARACRRVNISASLPCFSHDYLQPEFKTTRGNQTCVAADGLELGASGHVTGSGKQHVASAIQKMVGASAGRCIVWREAVAAAGGPRSAANDARRARGA